MVVSGSRAIPYQFSDSGQDTLSNFPVACLNGMKLKNFVSFRLNKQLTLHKIQQNSTI